MYKATTAETRGTVIQYDHIEKLEHFADRFKLEAVFAHVVSIVDDKTIHLFMLRVADIKKQLDKVGHGYRLRFGNNHLSKTIALPYVDYSVWRDETIGARLYQKVPN
jgi:hypothetical protein